MIVTLFLESVASAGLVYTREANFEILSLDTRSLEIRSVGAGPPLIYPGMALDPATATLWFYDPSSGWPNDELVSIDLRSFGSSYYGPQGLTRSSALAFDPNAGLLFAFGWGATSGMFSMPGTVPWGDPGFGVDGADWSDLLGGIVLQTDGNPDYYLMVPGVGATFLALTPPEMLRASALETAVDSDTRLIWSFDRVGNIWAVEPVNFTVVAYLSYPVNVNGGAGSIDDVPAQTPELLVTGECPGTVYVTVVDATPGSHVRIASATRRGSRTIPGGPCGGQQSALGNPTPRFDLVASSAGIASTRITATAGMCGQVALQALDEGSCQLTSARVMP
jgi:hypothetical protein